MISLKYFDKFTSQNNNLVIFITKLTELRTISLPFVLNIDLNNQSLLASLNKKKYLELFHLNNNPKIHYKIIVKLIDNDVNSSLSVGHHINNLFDYNKDKNITFLFSKSIEKKNLISNIIFYYQIRSYTFDRYKTKQKNIPENLFVKKIGKKITSKIKYDTNLIKSINYTKDLISEPANILNPVTYAEKCKKIKIKGLKIKILKLDQLNKIGMEALTAVSKGSIIEPRVVIFEWNLKRNIKPIVLVGKGVTFDSGGISLKPSSGMEEMIMDMGGSAVVVGSMMNAALNKSKKSLVGIIGLVENMPDGNAQRPGDIVKSLSGKTIEVLNTDAEGRLVLADLITYIQKQYYPFQIIDFATLTGAIMIALGTHKAGLFSNNDKLANKIEEAGNLTGEFVWRLPLGDEYDLEIDSNRADMKNIGSTRFGGSIQAAQFIKRFINNNIPWAHLDIAGVTWSMKSTNKLNTPGATAFGVRLIDQFLKK